MLKIITTLTILFFGWLAKAQVTENSPISDNKKSTMAIYARDTISAVVSNQAKITHTGFLIKLAFNEEAKTFSKEKCNQSLSLNTKK